jgi:hypothetical protein
MVPAGFFGPRSVLPQATMMPPHRSVADTEPTLMVKSMVYVLAGLATGEPQP